MQTTEIKETTELKETIALREECKKIFARYREDFLKSKDTYLINLRLTALDRLNESVQPLIASTLNVEIVLGIVRKKAKIISRIVCDVENDILAMNSRPRYNGKKYVTGVPEAYFIPEEELLYWSALGEIRELDVEELRRKVIVFTMVFYKEGQEAVFSVAKNSGLI